ncbi:DUF3857 domain-containing protein [Caulobacter sp. SL161]|uniref:DUF3857 domain-containing protein n=1 Tax=Caulobacter sp. SL161 TaxID=2995156 RepID=UPI002275D4F8|nr:DUF3857 domain-containing protein [Caulobacter sp. SL161]MCY1647236.1 DUF3857 domain-containing protein [Caulobacter sp. SL161]
MFGEDGSGARFEVGAPGDWVIAARFEPDLEPPSDSIDGGRRFWLSDTQIDLRRGGQAWFSRVVAEVVTADGLQPIGQISVDFEPSYERLVLHHVRILRAGETREIEIRPLVSVLRRERDLERAMYDGRYTAHLVVPDVRVGDIVDYSYTLHGAHPSFRGLFGAEFGLQWSCWVAQTRVRLLADEERTFDTRTWNEVPAPKVSLLEEGGREWLWNVINQPGVRSEQNVPGWIRDRMALRLADRTTWADIAALFAPSYETSGALPDDLEARAIEIESQAADQSARAVAALRLVQHGLRYHSVSLGDGGFAPRSIEHIWAVRAGDCKDSSRLLAALLRRLGLEADPALVHTWLGQDIKDDPPAPNAFNHCIVRTRVAGRTYWLDATRYPQGGALESVSQARYGWALPLVEGAALEAMGEDTPTPICDARERFELDPAPDGAGRLTIDTHYRGWRADDIRRRLASEGPDAVARSYREYYERFFGAVTELAPMTVDDNVEANVIRIGERYLLARPWERIDEKRGRFQPLDDIFAPHLTTQRSAKRRTPIDLGAPRSLSVETLIKLPHAIRVTPWDDVFEAPGVRASSRLEPADQTGTLFRLARGLTISRTEVRPEDAEALFNLREGAINASVMITDTTDKPKATTGFQLGEVNLDYRVIWVVFWLLIVIGGQVVSRIN